MFDRHPGSRGSELRAHRRSKDAEIRDALSLLGPDDLFPVWRHINSLERAALVRTSEAERWENAIFSLMLAWRLDPGAPVRLDDDERTLTALLDN